MKKAVLGFGVLTLVGCNAQEAPKVESTSTSEIISYVKKNHTESDPAATLNFLQLTEISLKNLSVMQVFYNSDATEVKLVSKDHKVDEKFTPFNNWQSVKIIRKPDSDQWHNFLVEVFDVKGYEESKNTTFSICKKVWNKIDERVPTVIDELAMRLKEYEKAGQTLNTQHIQYGYVFNLDASHFKNGYPIVCSVSYDRK